MVLSPVAGTVWGVLHPPRPAVGAAAGAGQQRGQAGRLPGGPHPGRAGAQEEARGRAATSAPHSLAEGREAWKVLAEDTSTVETNGALTWLHQW